MYFGEWREGKPWGSGVMIELQGNCFVRRGDFVAGQASGFVVMSSHPYGTEYAGEMCSGNRHGFGVQSFPGGSKLMGRFSEKNWKRPKHMDKSSVYNGPFVSLEAGKLTIQTYQMDQMVSQVPFVQSDPEHALLLERASKAEAMARRTGSVADSAMMVAECNSNGPTVHATTAAAIQFRPSIVNKPISTYGPVLGLRGPNSTLFFASITNAPMYAILGTAPSNVSYGCVNPRKEAIAQGAVAHFVHTRHADGIEKAFLLKGPMDVQGVVNAVLHCERGDPVDTPGDGPRGGEGPYTDCRQCPISALLGFKRSTCNAIQVGAPVCITGLVNKPHYNSEEGIMTKILNEHAVVTLRAGPILKLKKGNLVVQNTIPVFRTVKSECFCHVGATSIESRWMPIENCHLQLPGPENPKAERLKEWERDKGIGEALHTGACPTQ